jgi:uncharacterized cupin superfamily protein
LALILRAVSVATRKAGERVQDGDLAAAFRERGHVGPIPLFSRRECRSILAGLRSERRSPLDWEKGWAAVSPTYYALAISDRILDLVGPLLGSDVLLWGASLQDRPPRAVHPWHTDIESADPGSETATVWIGLAHTNAGSSLKLVPFSHGFGAPLQQVFQEHGKDRQDVTDADVAHWAKQRDERSGIVRIESGDGEAVIFDGRLWHGSENLNRFGTRQAVLLQYVAPSTAIRIPNLRRLTWPFELYETPKPPCVAVSGRATGGQNRLVPGPVATEDGSSALGSGVYSIKLPLEQDAAVGWKPHPLFHGATADLTRMGCHVSILDPGKQPHPPHRHDDEEVLVILDGEADLVLEDPTNSSATVRRHARRGSLAFYPARLAHTIHNVSEAPATYLMFKWIGDPTDRREALDCQVVDSSEQAAELRREPTDFATTSVWDGGTEYLRHFHAHITVLEPGAGYEPHVDAYDVGIVVLEGTVETLGERVGPHGTVFYLAGEPHGMRNVGDEPAVYLVFEFHGRHTGIPRRRARVVHLASRAARAPRRLKRALARWG